MGFRFRKSINLGGGFKVNLSKSGVGYSFGGKGFRYTKKANGGTRTTVSIPGTGLSHVSDKSRGTGCLTILIIYPLKLCWWIIYGTFWFMWQICYWTVKLCFVLPIKYLIQFIKNKKQEATINTQQELNLDTQQDK